MTHREAPKLFTNWIKLIMTNNRYIPRVDI